MSECVCRTDDSSCHMMTVLCVCVIFVCVCVCARARVVPMVTLKCFCRVIQQEGFGVVRGGSFSEQEQTLFREQGDATSWDNPYPSLRGGGGRKLSELSVVKMTS